LGVSCRMPYRFLHRAKPTLTADNSTKAHGRLALVPPPLPLWSLPASNLPSWSLLTPYEDPLGCGIYSKDPHQDPARYKAAFNHGQLVRALLRYHTRSNAWDNAVV
jgi:hypothetical protein